MVHRPVGLWMHVAVAVLMATGISAEAIQGSGFQFRSAEWKFPVGAADFLLAHHITGPLFNTYEYGGYLMWRLWPGQRVFIDGRALSETVFQDYRRILYDRHDAGGKSRKQLLDGYGVQTIVIGTFEYYNGLLYLLAPALADPAQTEWKLIYGDAEALVFMRHPPQGVQVLNSLQALPYIEAGCTLHMEHEPEYTRCARRLAQMYQGMGDIDRERDWLAEYLRRPHPRDDSAWRAYEATMP